MVRRSELTVERFRPLQPALAWRRRDVALLRAEEEARALREENARLKVELARQRASSVRSILAWEKEQEDRVRTEEAWHATHREFTSWFTSADMAMTCIGSDGLIDQANEHQLQLLGYSRYEYLGHPIGEFLRDREVLGAITAALSGRELFQNREASMRCRDGRMKPVMISTTAFGLGATHGICCYMRDLSEIVQSRSERERSERLFRQLGEHIREVFWMSTPQKEQMLYVSPAYEKVWGSSCQTLYDDPSSFLDRIHEDDRERVRCALDHQAEEGAYHEEYRVVRKDGTVRWVRDRAFPVYDEHGKVYRIAGLAEDITALKGAESELRKRASQQEALAELGRTALADMSLDNLFDEAVERLENGLDVEFTEILEMMPEQGDLLLRAGRGWAPGLVGQARVSAKDSQVDFTLRSGKPVVFANVETEQRFKQPPLLAEPGTASGMSVVIEGREKPFGILGAYTSRRRQFGKEDVNLLQAVGHILAAVVKRHDSEKTQQELSVQLALQGQRLDDILKNIPAVVWESEVDPVNRQIRPVFVSDYVETLLGFPKEAWTQNPDLWLERIHPEDREYVKRRAEKVFTEEELGTEQFRWIARDGRPIWVQSSKRIVRDADGNPVGLRGVNLDVSDRKWAETEKETAERRFQAFMDHSPVVALMKDKDGRFIYGNRLFREWCDRLGLDWFNSTDYDLFPQELAGRYRRLDRQALEQNITTQTLEISYDNDGAPSYWNVLRFPVGDPEGPRRTLGIAAIDVTERRRLERDILEISDREQRRLGQELHDGLCQHLLGVVLMTKTLGDRMAKKNLPEATDVQTINGFLSEALGLARALMRGFHLVNVEENGLNVALSEFADTTAKLFDKSCEFRSNIRVEVKEADVGTHLFRIAQEATHNAIKHGQSDSVTISLDREDDQLLLTVENDGRSFPEVPPSGPGMGIRTMRYRAELIGACLEFANRSGGGTVVTCRVPTGPAISFV